jgi:hypothetical protein
MTELELLRAYVKGKHLVHPKNPDKRYRMMYVASMHDKTGEWVDAMVYAENGAGGPTYVRSVHEFQNFTAADPVNLNPYEPF